MSSQLSAHKTILTKIFVFINSTFSLLELIGAIQYQPFQFPRIGMNLDWWHFDKENVQLTLSHCYSLILCLLYFIHSIDVLLC